MLLTNLYQISATLPDGRVITRFVVPLGSLTDEDLEHMENYVEEIIDTAALSISNESDHIGFVTIESQRHTK